MHGVNAALQLAAVGTPSDGHTGARKDAADEEEQTAAAARGERVLTQEVVSDALETLGHNESGQLAYIGCALEKAGLSDIAVIAGFPFLQRLTLDHNALTSLAPLASLACLVHLSAHHNVLTDGVFDELRHTACTLEYLDLSHNRLCSLRGVSQLTYLLHLAVDGNELSALSAADLGPLHTLLYLSLAHNRIADVAHDALAGCSQLCHLDLSHNALRDVRFVTVAALRKSLSTLLLAHNAITTVRDALGMLDALVTLDLSHNALGAVQELCQLRGIAGLRELAVQEGNAWVLAPDVDAASDAGDVRTAAASTSAVTSAIAQAEEGDEAREVDFAAMSAPQLYGVLRQVVMPAGGTGGLQARRRLRRAEERARLPYTQQVFLWLLCNLPQLATLDGAAVRQEDVARAHYYYYYSSSGIYGEDESMLRGKGKTM